MPEDCGIPAVQRKRMSRNNQQSFFHRAKPFWTLGLLLSLAITLVGCQSLPLTFEVPWQTQQSQQTPTATRPNPLTETPARTETLPTPTVALPPKQIILWVPPEMDPMGSDPAAEILRNKLNEFTHTYNVEVQVRLKALSGQAGLLDSLRTTSEAAPVVLPDLILLRDQDLDTAAQDGLIFTGESLASMMNDTDWFPYAQQMSLVDEIVYGIPFIGDPLVMVYDSQNQLAPAAEWESIPTNYGYFGFAADDPQASFVLTLYLAMGGRVTDTQGRPMLEEALLTKVLQLLKDANTSRHINSHSLEMQSSIQVWEAFDDWMFDTAIVPAHLVLSAVKQSRIGLPKPVLTEPSRTTITGLAWAISSPAPERQQMAINLLNSLEETEFLAQWSEAFGILPARPSALGQWKNETLKPALENISNAAMLFPANEIVSSLGPILRNATLSVLRDNAEPKDAAEISVESIQ